MDNLHRDLCRAEDARLDPPRELGEADMLCDLCDGTLVEEEFHAGHHARCLEQAQKGWIKIAEMLGRNP